MIEFAVPLGREWLAELLAKRGVDLASYSLSGGHPAERYVLDQRGYEWVVYYSERGIETGLRSFPSETWRVATLPTCSGETGPFTATKHERGPLQ